MMTPGNTTPTYAGIVAIVGRPNAGKSTLINELVGAKVSIVSRKAQTTRMRIMGVLTEEDKQMVFIDTPGLFTPKTRFEEAMAKSIQASMYDADHVLLVVDASRSNCVQENQGILSEVSKKNNNLILVLNKIDLIPKSRLLEIAGALEAPSLFMISAETGDGVDDLKNALLKKMPEGPFLFPADALTNLPERLYAAEITREQIFNYLHDELPYQIYVETDKWEVSKKGDIKIYQTIYVLQEKHRGIVLGDKGFAIKRLSMKSREELERALGIKCHLFLHVKADPKWQEKKELYHILGLEY